jgi:hypothetical protein
MITRPDTSNYNGNEVLNDAARKGDLATVQRMIGDQSDWARWQAAIQAWHAKQWEVIDALLEAGVGEVGRNALLEMIVSGAVVEWTERLLHDGTSEQARGRALNSLAERQNMGDSRSVDFVDDYHDCVRAVLAAGVDAADRRRAQKTARANGDKLLAAWLAD